MPRLLPPTLILIAAVAIPASAATDHVLCRTIRLPRASASAPAFLPFSRLAVADRFTPEGRLVDVRKPTSICVPVGAEGTPIDPAATFLAGYGTRPSRTKPPQSHFQGQTVDVQTPWSAEQLRVLGRDDLRVPALAAADPDDPGPAAELDQFACYDVRALRKFHARMVELDGAGNPAIVEITRAVRLCLPADLAGTNPLAVGKTKAWLCLAARLPRDSGPRADDTQGDVLTIRDRFGRSTMTLGASSELCVTAAIGGPLEAPTATATPTATAPPAATATPVASGPAATPSPSPSPGPSVVAIRVEPAHVVRMPGESYTYVAIGSMSDGTERNLTEDVLWSCDFGCEAPNEPGDRGRVVATTLSPPYTPPFDFYADVWATDPATGIASQYVIFEVSSDPIPLVIYPQYTIIRELTYDYLTALALDEQGAYRNATQDVLWSSTDPSVAAVENHAEVRSRVDAVSPGVADIYATDPRSGAVSGPATFRIFGPLIGIDVHTRGRSIQSTRETMDVGEVIRALAWSIFEDGFPFEGFDPVTFTSSDPTVAVPDVIPQPTPLPGGPSYPDGPNFPRYHVLRGVAPGRIRLSARDDLSGVGSHDLGCDVLVTVRQPVSSLRLNPLKRSVGLDEIVKLTALGVGSDGSTRNFTQRVVYTSSDPSVIVATNETGDRSKLVVVGPGTAVISAVDPATGFTTDASGGGTTITVRNERADGITVRPAEFHTMLGTTPRFDAVAHYPSGKTATVNESVVWASSEPEVANFYVYGVRNRIAPYVEGTTKVSAAMPSLGLTSPDATLVIEPPVSLQVLPATANLPVDGEQKLHVLAKLAGGSDLDLGADDAFGTGYVGLASSAPAVVRDVGACAPIDWIDLASAALGRAPGVATISAHYGYDSGTELTSTATGGDATITVTAP